MTAQELADLHARCFDEGPRAWNAAEFESFLTSRTEIVLSDAHALGVIRIVAGEAEVLTICVEPACQGTGAGRAMLARLMHVARDAGAHSVFLEVAVDNTRARALYDAAGFALSGHRRGYYRRPTGPVDALVLVRDLTTTPRQG